LKKTYLYKKLILMIGKLNDCAEIKYIK